MDNEIYTVEQVAELINLHPKTVRLFIKEGKLEGIKVGKQWRITASSVHALLKIKEDSKISHKNQSAELYRDKKEKTQVTAIVDYYYNNKEEIERISSTLTAIMFSKTQEDSNARIDHIYYEEEQKARYILWGNPLFVSKVLSCLNEITK